MKGVKKDAKTFSIAGDLNVELGLMCTDESDIEEFNEIFDPLCWQGYTHDPGGHKKFMWYSIMKEFRCKVSSAWSSHNLSWRRRWSRMLATSCARSFACSVVAPTTLPHALEGIDGCVPDLTDFFGEA